MSDQELELSPAERPLQPALPRELYVDEEAWRTERKVVIFGEWVCVGRADDLGLAGPSRATTVDVAGESVLLTSDEDGVLHAAYNVCRHRGCQLRAPDQPASDASAVRCPYHSWTYGLDGRLLKAPHADVPDRAAFALTPVGVDTWGGFVLVNLTPATAGPTTTCRDSTGPAACFRGTGKGRTRA